MSIEITGLRDKQIQNTGDNRPVTASKSGTSSKKSPSGSGDDRVSLTSSATQLQELTAQVAQLPVVDIELVSEAQRAVATGSFVFEPIDAANNLLTQEKELATLKVQ